MSRAAHEFPIVYVKPSNDGDYKYAFNAQVPASVSGRLIAVLSTTTIMVTPRRLGGDS